MAKKTRTPPPPRRVQAPQPRAGGRGGSTADERRARRLLYLAGASGIVLLAAVAIFLSTRDGGSAHNKPKPVAFADLPGMQTGKPPWSNGAGSLDDRLDPLGMPALTEEGTRVHIHQHLDLFVDGKKVKVPEGIGIQPNQYILPLHVHDTSGIIHVESPTKKNFSLGELFGIWGVKLSKECVGGVCDGVKTWVNGKPYSGDPANLVLKSHQQIVIVDGKKPAKLPLKYDFPAGT